ncbi:MAG: hypothetical protein QOE55_833 [Acidobacteriaceae bacterium]|nr:hypothetical protein [Acidobacteriaceae bacterium]
MDRADGRNRAIPSKPAVLALALSDVISKAEWANGRAETGDRDRATLAYVP